MKRPLRHTLFGGMKTDHLHLLLVGNSISLAPGLIRQFAQPWPIDGLTWVFKVFELLAVMLLAGLVTLEVLEYRSRPDRRHLLNIPWPDHFPE